MTNNADYETLLRSMSALSQQFSQRKPRLQGTPPNPLYNQQRSSSRVSKPRSTNASPSSVSAQRRRAPTAPQPQRPFTQNQSQLRSSQHPINSNEYFQGPSSDADRPRSWHADMHTPWSWMQSSHPAMTGPNEYANPYMLACPAWNAMPSDGMFSAMNSMPWMQSQLGAWNPYGTFNNNSMYNFAMQQPLEQPTQQPAQNALFESEVSEDDDDEEQGNDLVGMGLYDKSPSSKPSLLLSARTDESEDEGKGLQLEEGWAPPADQVPDTEADEGSDTPVTSEFKGWGPEEDAGASQPAAYYDHSAMPQVRQQTDANNMFFDDDGNLMTDDMVAAAQNKPLPMAWYGSEWTGYPGYGFYHY